MYVLFLQCSMTTKCFSHLSVIILVIFVVQLLFQFDQTNYANATLYRDYLRFNAHQCVVANFSCHFQSFSDALFVIYCINMYMFYHILVWW